MKIAKLRHRVYVQTPTVTTNDRGAEVLSWADSGAIAAEIRTTGGDERTADNEVLAVRFHQITLRWPMPSGVTLTSKSRIKWVSTLNSVTTTRYFGLTFIGEPDNVMRSVRLDCTEIAGDSGIL